MEINILYTTLGDIDVNVTINNRNLHIPVLNSSPDAKKNSTKLLRKVLLYPSSHGHPIGNLV